MANKYQILFQSKSQNISYKLEIYESIDYVYPRTPAWTTVNIPANSLKKLEYNISYKEIQLGVPDKIPNLELEFDLTFTESESLNEKLLNPFKIYDRICGEDFTGYSSLDISDKFYTVSNLFVLSSDKGLGGGYENIFVGVQKEGIEGKLDVNGIYSFTVTDLYYTVAQNIKTDELLWYYKKTADFEEKKFYIDYAYNYLGNKFAMLNTSLGDYYFICDRLDFDTHIRRVYENYLKSYLSNWAFNFGTFTISNYNIKRYKQSYEGNIRLGELISDQYLLAFHTNKAIADVGESDFQIIGGATKIINENYATLWDYFKAVFESELVKTTNDYRAGFEYTKVIPFNQFSNNVNLDLNEIEEVEITLNNNNVGRVTVSKTDTSGDDIKKIDAVKNKSFNTTEFNISEIFNSDMVVYSEVTNRNWNKVIRGISSDYIRNRNEELHYLNILYKETITDITVADEYIRADSFVDIPASSTVYSSDYTGYNNTDLLDYIDVFLPNSSFFDKFILYSQVKQTLNSNGKSASNLLINVLPADKIELNFGMYADTIIEEIYNIIDTKFTIDLSQLVPYQPTILDNYNNEFAIIEARHIIVGDPNEMDKVQLKMVVI